MFCGSDPDIIITQLWYFKITDLKTNHLITPLNSYLHFYSFAFRLVTISIVFTLRPSRRFTR